MAAPPSYSHATNYPYHAASPYPTTGAAAPYPTTGVAAPYPITAPYPTTGEAAPPVQPQTMPIGMPAPNISHGPPAMPIPIRAIGAYGAPDVMYDDNAAKEESTVGLTNTEWAGGSFSDKRIRMAFIRKVYLILTTQLLVTVAFVAFFLFHKPTQYWIQNDGFWFYYVSYATFLVTYITLVCCPSVRRSYPGNFICLGIFTLAFSYMTGTISSFYGHSSVLIAVVITALVCLSITLFAIQTKIDFTMCNGLIFCLCMVVILFGISCFIVYMCCGYSRIMQCVYGALAALLFSLFLAYDTQMLVGGRKHQLSEEEHVFAALQLYLDVVYLFLIILSLFGSKN